LTAVCASGAATDKSMTTMSAAGRVVAGVIAMHCSP
jgi:hypothetical protein